MALTLEEKRAIIAYRLQKSEQAMVEARDNAQLKHWNLVANRLYYAVFHAATALLIDKGFSSKTHSGVICILGQEFVMKVETLICLAVSLFVETKEQLLLLSSQINHRNHQLVSYSISGRPNGHLLY